MSKKKIGLNFNQAAPEGLVVVFGTQRIGAIYALRNGINPSRIVLATMGPEALRGCRSDVPITVVRVSEEAWQPPTNPCATRTREVEQALKILGQEGYAIRDKRLV